MTIEDRSDEIAVLAYLDASPQVDGIIVRDPRSAVLGYRAYVPRERAPATGRIAAPRGPAHRSRRAARRRRFRLRRSVSAQSKFELINGVDFKKGCYIGQEVVSRMQHRGTRVNAS